MKKEKTKMEEMRKELEQLKSCGEKIVTLANTLIEELGSDKKEEVKEEEKSYTLVEVRKIMAEKSRAGKTAEVRAALVKFGADKLSKLNEKDYAALVKEVEVL